MNDETNDTFEAETPRAADVPQDPGMRLGTLRIYGDRSKLFGALAKAQAGYQAIKRTRTVQVRSDKGNYTFDYAPLEEVISATMPSLNQNGLAWLSMLADGEEGSADLHTLLTHESGAFLHVVESLAPVNKAQERGSQITYRRRYQYQCVTGTSPEVDDDGNAADGNKVEGMSQRPGPRREPPAPRKEVGGSTPPGASTVAGSEPAPKAQANGRERGVDPAQGGPAGRAPTNTVVDPGTGEAISEELSASIRQAFKDLGYGKGPQPMAICRRVTGKPPEALDAADGLRLLAYLKSPEAAAEAGNK